MRCITISYQYDGDEAVWRAAIEGFIGALNGDTAIAGKFNYQVCVADDGKTRIHWGRWDSGETLAHVQAQEYFKTFAALVGGFSGGGPIATVTNVIARTESW